MAHEVRPMNKVERIARACHEINRAYCASQGDHSQPSWEEAPDWQRKSAINGVHAHLSAVTELTPEQSHELWLREKAHDDWRWGPVKDPAKKEHPCFLPYDQLPAAEKAKDYLFRAVVKQMNIEIPDPVVVNPLPLNPITGAM